MKRGVIFALNLLLLFVHISCNEDSGTGNTLQPPTVSSITPNQASRAERVVGTIVGTNFTGTTQVFLGDGVTVEGFTVLNPGTIEVRFIVNTNTAAGRRPVQVTTSVGTASADLFEVLDNRAPLSRISVDPSSNGATNTVYTFDGLKSDDPDGNIVRFEFEFGDGKKANGPVVTHKFATTGEFEVIMRVTDDQDAQGIATTKVNVKPGTAPTAKFNVFPKDGDINTIYTFDATNSDDPDGSIDEYIWDFGNGKTAKGQTASFHFGNSGVFSVTLIVKDNQGLQNSARKDVTVGAFDSEKAAQQIRDIIVGFFRRYSDLQGLTAEQIVADWSTNPNCRGRAHEINIINKQKQTIQQTRATPGNIDVSFSSFSRARALAPADFAWTEFNGNSFTGFAVHDFEVIFENGEWWICNFVLI
jgi:chitodextrinase